MHIKENTMNTRFCSVIAVATLMTLSSGCSGTRNFLFGRGARCGLCNTTPTAPQFGNTMQMPCPPTYPTPQYQGGVVAAPQAGCGCNSYAGNEYSGQAYSAGSCGSCNDMYQGAYGGCGCIGDCGCGNVVEGYGPVVSDPYMQGEIVGGSTMPYQEQIIGGQIPGGQIPGSQAYPNSAPPLQSDDFNARKFDSDGNRILWEEPLPSGTTSL